MFLWHAGDDDQKHNVGGNRQQPRNENNSTRRHKVAVDVSQEEHLVLSSLVQGQHDHAERLDRVNRTDGQEFFAEQPQDDQSKRQLGERSADVCCIKRPLRRTHVLLLRSR